jgi:hypothetical protein
MNQTISGVRAREIVPTVGDVRAPHAEHINRASAKRHALAPLQLAQTNAAGQGSHLR